MKKILALIMALALVMGLAVTAFAAGNCSITITPATAPAGSTAAEPVYTAYKILDAVIGGNGSLGTDPDEETNTTTPVTYTMPVNSPYKTVLATYFTFEEIPGDATKLVAKKKAGFDAADLAAALAPVLTGAAGTATKSGDNYVIDNLDPGYYVITSSVGTNMIVDTLDNVEIESKNEYPTLELKIVDGSNLVDRIDLDAGSTATYQVKVHAPGAGDIIVHVQNDSGITPDGTMSIADDDITFVDKTTAGCSDSACGRNNNDLHIKISKDAARDTNGYVTFTFTATVGDVSGAYRNNGLGKTQAYLTSGGYKSATDEVEVVNFEVNVYKFRTVDGTETDMPGAGFVLAKTVDGATKYYSYDESNEVVTWVDTITDSIVRTSDTKGEVWFPGLANGNYTLIEHVVPTGYNKAADQTVTVNNADIGCAYNGYDNAPEGWIKVENKTGSELPSTGGIGTTLFYVVGALMMTGAAVLMITKKRMSV